MIFINTATKSTGLFKPFFPISIPYGIGHLMGVLRNENKHFSFVDQQIKSNIFKELKKIINTHSKPYIFGISTLTEAYSEAIVISNKLKGLYPDSVIIFGGIHPSALPKKTLNDCKSCDYVFMGEADGEIANIYDKIKSGENLKSVNGIAYRAENDVAINPPAEIIKDINELPKFPYDLFTPFNQYQHGHIISSRGCPHNCSFCCVKVVGKRRYRYKNTKNTIEELEFLAHELQQKHISFFDDNFLANKERIKDLCEAISKSEKLKNVTYSFQARIRDVDEDIFKLMFKSGFKAVFFGIESVSKKLLKQIGKDESVEEISTAIKLAQKIGFKVMANFLFCLPNESKKERTDCVNFAIKHNIDLVKYNNVVPYPGTQMYEDLNAKNEMNILPKFSNFNSQEVLVRSIFKKKNFPYIPQNSTAYGIEKEIIFAYYRTYFRLKTLSKIIFKPNWGDVIFSSGKSFILKLSKFPSFLLLLADISIKFGLVFLSVFKKDGIKLKDIIKTVPAFFK